MERVLLGERRGKARLGEHDEELGIGRKKDFARKKGLGAQFVCENVVVGAVQVHGAIVFPNCTQVSIE